MKGFFNLMDRKIFRKEKELPKVKKFNIIFGTAQK